MFHNQRPRDLVDVNAENAPIALQVLIQYNDVVYVMSGGTVKGEQREHERPKDTALWDTTVQCERDEGMVLID